MTAMEWYYFLTGEGPANIEWWQMIIRAMIILVIASAIVRLGGSRIFGRHAVLDIVLAVVLGSNFSRTLTGNAPLIPVIIATVVLVLLHATLIVLAQRFDWLSVSLKGRPTQLVEDGEYRTSAMMRSGIAEGDLAEAMRLQGHRPDLDRIEAAYIERNGDLSIIVRDDAPDEDAQ